MNIPDWLVCAIAGIPFYGIAVLAWLLFWRESPHDSSWTEY